MRKPDKFPDRNDYIGPSECAIACGLSSYMDPDELWEVKTLRRARSKTTAIMERGNMMEPVIINKLLTDFDLVVHGSQTEAVDEARPWFRGHCDGFISEYKYIGTGEPTEDMEGRGLAEIKAPGSRMVQKFGKTGLSPDYVLQVQLYMYLFDRRWVSVFYLDYDSNVIEQIDMKRDDAFIEAALKKVDWFWSHVVADERPPSLVQPLTVPGPDGGDVTTISLSLARAFVECLENVKVSKEMLKATEDRIKKQMIEANSTKALCPGVVSTTWTETVRNTVQARPLLDWTEALCLAFINERESDVVIMIDRFLEDPEMFTKSSTTRTFRKKVLDDE